MFIIIESSASQELANVVSIENGHNDPSTLFLPCRKVQIHLHKCAACSCIRLNLLPIWGTLSCWLVLLMNFRAFEVGKAFNNYAEINDFM